MKLKKVMSFFCLAGLLGLISCGSAPKTEEKVEEPVPEEVAVEEVVEQVVEEVKEEVKEEKDFSMANSQLLAGTESARKEAEEAGASKYYSEMFAEIDEEFANLKKNMEADPKADYSEQLRELTSKYNALAKAAKAKLLKEKIDEYDLSSYDKSSYDKGNSALEEFDAMKSSASGKELLSKADDAFNSFTTVFVTAFKSLAGSERKAALEAKKNADSVKAGVSQKDAYKKAADTFKKADTDFVTANIEGAYKGYLESKKDFTQLYEKVSEARKAAQEAIERAKNKVEEIADYAADADKISPLGDGEVKGIESEDAKLLEDDNFEAAENAEINVEEGAAAKAAELATEALENVSDETIQKAEEIKNELKESLKEQAASQGDVK